MTWTATYLWEIHYFNTVTATGVVTEHRRFVTAATQLLAIAALATGHGAGNTQQICAIGPAPIASYDAAS